MLTILAYIVFIPALVWNVVFGMLVEEKGYSWVN
jgi:hypothetical protein